MARIRVHELAAEMGIDPRRIVEEGKKHGIALADAAAVLSTSDVFILRAFLRDAPRAAPASQEPETATASAAGEGVAAGETQVDRRAHGAAELRAAEAPLESVTAALTQGGSVAPHIAKTVAPEAALRPHVVATALDTGQVVWAQVAGAQATLRSGARLHLTTRPPDGIAGWRPVRIVNSEKLLASALPMPGVALPELDADDPGTLWPMPDDSAPPPNRPESFPVGVARSLMRKNAAYGIVAVVAALALSLGILIGRAVA